MKISALLVTTITMFCASCTNLDRQKHLDLAKTTYFVEQTSHVFNKDARNRKGWDAPVIADLDQDGYPDILLNDHGYGARVMWNNQGKFAFPYDIIMGDVHGMSVGDINFDGKLDVIIARGGGSGANARNAKIFTVDKQRNFKVWQDFKKPLAKMRGRTVKFVDLDNDGDLDLLNFAFESSSKRKQKVSESYVYKNDGSGHLSEHSRLPMLHKDGQKTLITDFNQDNKPDLLIYGYGAVRAFKGNGDLTFTEVSKQVFPAQYQNVTSIAELDYDNDGDFDIVMTRGYGFEKGETFYDAENKLLGFYTKRGAFQFEDLLVGDTLKIENYQCPWPEKLPYIGESSYRLNYPGETHSGRNINLISSESLGFPDDIRGKKGTFIGFVGNEKWRMAGNSFAPFSGVIHGVKQYPKYVHKSGLSNILLENRQGRFVDVSNLAGFTDKTHSTGIVVGDFDNNGFNDLLVINRGNLISANQAQLYFNEANQSGGRTFVEQNSHGVISPELGATGMNGEVIDFNLDGQLDVVTGNERGMWHLFKNVGAAKNNNNFVALKVGHSPSGKATALGALVTISACNNSQIKHLGSSGASYSESFNQTVHFGVGNCTTDIQVKVRWSNNEYKQIVVSANTFTSL